MRFSTSFQSEVRENAIYDEGSYSRSYCDSFFIFEEAGSSVESDLRRGAARPITARDPRVLKAEKIKRSKMFSSQVPTPSIQ